MPPYLHFAKTFLLFVLRDQNLIRCPAGCIFFQSSTSLFRHQFLIGKTILLDLFDICFVFMNTTFTINFPPFKNFLFQFKIYIYTWKHGHQKSGALRLMQSYIFKEKIQVPKWIKYQMGEKTRNWLICKTEVKLVEDMAPA